MQAQHLFIVRVWLEQSEGQSCWRGSVEHTPSGKRTYFQTLESLCQFIAQVLEPSGFSIPSGRSQPSQ